METKLRSQAFQMDGWEQIQSSLTYASATTINSSVDLTGVIQKGDKLKINNTTAKYFYVLAVTSSLITVSGGSDYSVANAAITVPQFSKIENPQGFPTTFSLGTPSWTASAINFTNQPTAPTVMFWIINNICHVKILGLTNATSGGTGQFLCNFTAGYLPNVSDASGSAFNLSTPKGGYSYTQSGNNNRVYIVGYDGNAIAGNSNYFESYICYAF